MKKTFLCLLLFLTIIWTDAFAARIDITDFSNDRIIIGFEDIKFTDPYSGNGALSPILDYQSLGVIFYVHNDIGPGVDPRHDIFRLGGWCSGYGISIATNVGDNTSIEANFEFPVYQVGGMIGVSNAALKVYDEHSNLLEGYETKNVNYNEGTCEFIGIENKHGIRKAVFYDITNNGLVLSLENFIFTPLAFVFVDIDIKPGSDSNTVNPKSNGKIPVAILSTKDFDAPSQVDQNSLTFGRTGDEQSLAFCNRRPKDVNHDGLKDDLVCHFYTQIAGFKCGDTEGILRGKTLDGTPIAIEGRDSVKIVPCK